MMGYAQVWRSHLAYNNVTQIAMSQDVVYGLSDGSIFSVNKKTEKIRLYDRQSGLHGVDITCICYDEQGQQLLIGYSTGKIDILTSSGMQYIAALYEKDMTQRKTIYNVTISGRTAYLSTHFGIQTLDLRENKLVDSYWLRPGGEETPVQDVTVTKDSIYAFTEDSLFSAALTDNIVDYTYWKREVRSSRIMPDAEKGKHYEDATGHWYAGGAEGIVHQSVTERIAYKPQSPLSNIPYSLQCAHGRLYVVQGGRWASQYQRPGLVMVYDGERWMNTSSEAIKSHTGIDPLDFMNVAVDERDKRHFFVTSYGTGLYEFAGDTLLHHYLPGPDNTLEAVVPNYPNTYTRLDQATYDGQGNLWLLDAGDVTYPLVCYDANGQWHGVRLRLNNEPIALHTPAALIVDNRHTNYKWFATARLNTALFLLDDGGTPWDESDDQIASHNEWVTPEGRTVTPQFIRTVMQTSDGHIWLGTEQGIIIIEPTTDYFRSNNCIRPNILDENGENPMTELEIFALCEDQDGNIWVGTNTLGVYVLNASATEIVAHYTTDNSSMGSNDVLALATDRAGQIYIGTGNGLAEFQPHADPEGSLRTVDEEGRDLGSIMQWKLHLSYTNPDHMLATPERIYVLSSGALYYVDRADDLIGYMNKTTGLNGSTVTGMAYQASSQNLVIGYLDGRIDLVDKNDNVRQIPDLMMKASSVSVSINAISAGARRTYVSMPFGIMVINTEKGEISDTYYIGHEASSVNVIQVLESGDSIFAFSNDSLYAASLHDNLMDYSYWHSTKLPNGTITYPQLFQNELHLLADGVLYRRHLGQWIPTAVTTPLAWIHSSDNQLLTYVNGSGLYRITEDYQLAGLSNNYTAKDAVYSKGEYWLVEEEKGVIRLQNSGDVVLIPNGPNSNIGYFLHAAHGRIYSTVGGRWSSQDERPPRVNICTQGEWEKLGPSDFALYEFGEWIYALDPVSIAVDPNDPDHFYVASYGAGVYEYNHHTVKRYGDGMNGSTLRVVNSDPTLAISCYTRADGAMMDEQGNFWVLNATSLGQPVHVMTPDKKWVGLPLRVNGSILELTTPTGLRMDRRYSQRKWFMDQRVTQGIILMDDNGTPTKTTDDRCVKRSEFVDQNGNIVSPSFFFCMEQDQNDRMWIGTENGIILIDENTDLMSSNACRRIIIPRNDGTGLGDYLLGNEQINCMACDGGNRMWIGTAGSGLYLIEDDTITVAHFTENNSLLPSDNIQSIAIIPETGEVFVGTDHGIASYLSDASEARENMNDAYAFPNPVRPEYGGSVSITGLMDNSEVNIVDAGGNLVCKTRSQGGTAVWDCKRADGRLATAGIYTALCNTKGGKKAVKIMIIR